MRPYQIVRMLHSPSPSTVRPRSEALAVTPYSSPSPGSSPTRALFPLRLPAPSSRSGSLPSPRPAPSYIRPTSVRRRKYRIGRVRRSSANKSQILKRFFPLPVSLRTRRGGRSPSSWAPRVGNSGRSSFAASTERDKFLRVGFFSLSSVVSFVLSLTCGQAWAEGK